MKILVECGLVNDRKEGKWHHYSLNCETLTEFKKFIGGLTCEGSESDDISCFSTWDYHRVSDIRQRKKSQNRDSLIFYHHKGKYVILYGIISWIPDIILEIRVGGETCKLYWS